MVSVSLTICERRLMDGSSSSTILVLAKTIFSWARSSMIVHFHTVIQQFELVILRVPHIKDTLFRCSNNFSSYSFVCTEFKTNNNSIT